MKHFFVTYAPEHVQNVIGKIVAPNVSKILISQQIINVYQTADKTTITRKEIGHVSIATNQIALIVKITRTVDARVAKLLGQSNLGSVKNNVLKDSTINPLLIAHDAQLDARNVNIL